MGIKKYIRAHEKLMQFLSVFYNFIMFNQVSGRLGIKIYWRGAFLCRCRVVNKGSRNTVIIEKGCRLKNCVIRLFGNGNKIAISNDCEGNGLDLWVSDGSVVQIGHNSHFVGKVHIAAIEGNIVDIGEKCLFSSEVTIRTGDSHSILNRQGERINPSENVKIGNHVWIGNQVVILKGANVGSDCVVGTRSLVTGKEFKDNTVIAGSPAKIIKEEITWHHELI